MPHLRAREEGGILHLSWTRRTRTGGDNWQIEAPLGEETERYRVTIEANGAMIHEVEATAPPYSWLRTTSAHVTVSVAQVSAITGPGFAAVLTVD